jgi:hypothetical protein
MTTKKAADNFNSLVEILLETSRKKDVIDAYSKLSITEKLQLLQYTNSRGDESLFNYVQSWTKNLLR